MVQPLLCGDCEQRFGTLEDYAKRFFYGNSDPIRLKLPLSPDPLFMADYAKLKLFQLSLLWRASEATGEYFSAVQLSVYHNERLRSMLYNEDPGKDYEYPCVLARLIPSPRVEAANRAHGIAMETGSFAPICHRFSTWDCYTFVMGAIIWTFSVIHEGGIPEVIRNAYLRENGQFWLQQMEADKFLIHFCTKVVEAGNVTLADVEESIRAKSGLRTN